jgi:hypothetical protein
MKEALIEYLREQNACPGQTVQFGWLFFRVTENDGELDLETLDFKSMASYTKDFTVAEEINRSQIELLRIEGVEPGECNPRQFAVLSRSYSPGAANVFISRDSESDGNDSGWYIGIVGDTLDVNNPANLLKQSLYEISIFDHRFLSYWLLPTGYQIIFAENDPKIFRPNKEDAPDEKPVR